MALEVSFSGGKKVDANFKGFTIKTDQSEKDGGEGSAPTPSFLFFASLGTCAGLYALNFCEKRKIDTTQLNWYWILKRILKPTWLPRLS